MSEISELFNHVAHRPYGLPTGRWKYYQEWNKVLLLHWIFPYDILRNYVPANLNIDRFDGDCYVSLVAFTMQKIRPRNLPSISIISDFHEINLRTYIDNDNKKGVYFLNIEAGKYLSTVIAKRLSGLPYENSNINRTKKQYISVNERKDFHFDAAFEISEGLLNKSELDKWLTERYCLYLDSKGKTYRFDIHHKEWEIKAAKIRQLKLKYHIGNINLSAQQPLLVHYSEGVKVIAWKRQEI